jgi:hypothetical protein
MSVTWTLCYGTQTTEDVRRRLNSNSLPVSRSLSPKTVEQMHEIFGLLLDRQGIEWLSIFNAIDQFLN